MEITIGQEHKLAAFMIGVMTASKEMKRKDSFKTLAKLSYNQFKDQQGIDKNLLDDLRKIAGI